MCTHSACHCDAGYECSHCRVYLLRHHDGGGNEGDDGGVRSCDVMDCMAGTQPAVCHHDKHTHTHIQPFNGPLSATTHVSRYQKKHSPIHTHEEEEEGFAQATRSALSQRGLLDPIKPAYNQSRPDGRLN